MTTSVRDLTIDFHKLDKFEGVGFRRWQKKMHFLLTTLNVVYVISTPRPEETEEETLAAARARNKWDNDNYVCCGHILNGMSDELFDVYQHIDTAKALWDSLEAKYVSDDASSKRFLVSSFNSYKMVDSRSVMEQFHELQRILSQFVQHKLQMDEAIKVSSIVDKLPPSWKDVKRSLKHKKEDMSLEQLGTHLRIEEDLRMQDGKGVSPPTTVNIVEDEKRGAKRQGKRPSKGGIGPDSE
ncbi:PREDICTED: uncharacterized protein LOC104825272 [Tarenaya hassleriana]|uniref:uncharacterized protein LOC104825272 n=1 Tax=Tarenaya hassleriana TaxID=28532 RepID=UPI00053C3EC5|nr:PREDICTED: uncharacterized protein LOC104825272 [Tarenaya hassleriana]